jgi:hypothetical protein
VSVHAHAPQQIHAGRPPTERRRCIAITNPSPGRWLWRYDGEQHVRRYVEGIPGEQCTNGASPWLPEVDYCATHLPADAVLLVQQRIATYNELAAYLWASTLADHPYQAGAS